MQCEHCKADYRINEITPKMMAEKIADVALREILMDLYKKIEELEKYPKIIIDKGINGSSNYPTFNKDGVVYYSSIDLNHC